MTTIGSILQKINSISSLLPAADAIVTELLFDSRRLLQPQKTLFFAIQTEKADGHRFIPELIQKGVRQFIITEPIAKYQNYAQVNFIQVIDAVTAMQEIAAAHRQKFDFPIIGITGSNGKTIVKEWLSTMLSENYHLIANPNSYNSQIGVPYSVWQISRHHNLGIFEAGISQKGEMAQLARIIRPTIGILTNIGAAHSQFFQNEEEKLAEKIQLFSHCQSIIFCNDNPLIDKAFQQFDWRNQQRLSWGRNPVSDYQITQEIVETRQTIVTIHDSDFIIPFVDAASVENALHAVVLLLHLNFTAEQINHKLSLLTPVSMRMEVKEAIKQCIVINDTYSLDINSLRIALGFVQSQIRYRNRTVILSDFAQIGVMSESDFLEINQLLIDNGISKLIAVGENFYKNQHLFTIKKQFFFKETAALLQAIDTISFQQEAVLVKGARHYRFEKIVEILQLKSHRTILSVSLPALVNNLNYYRSFIKPETKVVAMVKAMCYGLGDAELINELQYYNIDYLAVAYTDEGVNLRKKNINLPIIVLGAEAESFEMMINYGLEPEIFNFYSLKEIEKVLSYHADIKEFKIHLKIDTGMHRLGFRQHEIQEVISIIKKNPQLKIASVFSHFAAAEDPQEDAFTQRQIAIFKEITDIITSQFDYRILRHIANSAGISRFPEAQFDMVRVGIGLYGFSSVPQDKPHLQHVATLRTVITHIVEIGEGETVGYNRTYTAPAATKVGIIPIGYADGLAPELGRNVGKVFINNQLVPIIGKICMDMTMINLTGISAQEGDEVIVYGEQNRIDDIAAQIGKIPYHLLTAISKRVPRIYIME